MKELISMVVMLLIVLGLIVYPSYMNDYAVKQVSEMANDPTPEPETASFSQEIDTAKNKPNAILANGLYSHEIVDGEKKAVAEFYFTEVNNYTASLTITLENKKLFTATSSGTYEIFGQTIIFKPIIGSFGLANGRYVITELSQTAFTLRKNGTNSGNYKKLKE